MIQLLARGQEILAIDKSPAVILHAGELDRAWQGAFHHGQHFVEFVNVAAMNDKVQCEADAITLDPFKDTQFVLMGLRAGDLVSGFFARALKCKIDLLIRAGLDHFQLSIQGGREETANEISGTKSHQHKLRVLEWIKRYRIGLTLNFVIHRRNIDELDEMLAMVESSLPGSVEFASVQYYGWAFVNRENLLPTRQQLDHCVERLNRAEEELRGKTRVVFVVPDYYAKYPKP